MIQVARSDAAHTLHELSDGLGDRARDERRAEDRQQDEERTDAHGAPLGRLDGEEQRLLRHGHAHQADLPALAAQLRVHGRPHLDARAGRLCDLVVDEAVVEHAHVWGELLLAPEPSHVTVREDGAVVVQHGSKDEVVGALACAQRGENGELVVGLHRLARLDGDVGGLRRQAFAQLFHERIVLVIEERRGQQREARRHEADEVENELHAQAGSTDWARASFASARLR